MISQDINALNQQLNDAGLLRREELVPKRVKSLQRVADLRTRSCP